MVLKTDGLGRVKAGFRSGLIGFGEMVGGGVRQM